MTSPLSPRFLKGALVTLALPKPTPKVVMFQYNPATLTRTLQAQTTGQGENGRAELVRFRGAPVETLSLEIELDATGTSGSDGSSRAANGLHPQLAALETLLYPPSAHVITNQKLLDVGVIEVIPPAAPFTLFIYGPRRILPVRINEFTITEEAHDARLNPILAKISLSLHVLSYTDLPSDHPGQAVFIAYQVAKEVAAALATGSNFNGITGNSTRIL